PAEPGKQDAGGSQPEMFSKSGLTRTAAEDLLDWLDANGFRDREVDHEEGKGFVVRWRPRPTKERTGPDNAALFHALAKLSAVLAARPRSDPVAPPATTPHSRPTLGFASRFKSPLWFLTIFREIYAGGLPSRFFRASVPCSLVCALAFGRGGAPKATV